MSYSSHPGFTHADSVDAHKLFRSRRIRDFGLALLPDILALGFVLALALTLLSREIVFGGSLDDSDILQQSIPVYSWYAAALRQGRLPLWSPEILGGFPLAFSQYGFFYPPDILLFRLLDTARAFHLSLALHLALAGGCTYWYGRVLGLRRLPALIAAVAFQMGNEAVAWAANGFIARSLFVLPALLAVTELLFRGKWRYWLLVPVIVGASMLGGYAQFVLFALCASAAYALVAAVVEWKSLGARTALAALGLLASGVALGLGLAMVRIAPTLALTSLSTRAAGMGLAGSSVDSIAPTSMVAGYLLPALNELSGDTVARPDYVSGPVLCLALLALLYRGRLGRVPTFHAGLAGVSIVLSLGNFTPFYGLLIQLPFFGYFRGPNRISLVAALAIAMLAAYALQWRTGNELPRFKRRRRFLIVLAIAGCILLGLGFLASALFQFGRDPISEMLRGVLKSRGWDSLNLLRLRVGLPLLGLAATPMLIVASSRRWLSHTMLEWCIFALTASTLFTLGWIQNGWLSPQFLSQPPVWTETLRSDTDSNLYRTFSWPPAAMLYNLRMDLQRAGQPAPSRDFERIYLRQFVTPDLNMLYGISTADGYEVLQSRRQALMSTYLGSERREKATFADGSLVGDIAMTRQLPERLNLMAAFNVKYLLNAFQVDDPRLELAGVAPVRIYPNRADVTSVYLYRLKAALPRVLVVPRAEVIHSERNVLETLTAGTVDLRHDVILEEQPPSLASPALTLSGSGVEVVSYRDDSVEIRTKTDGSGFLVLMDFLLPGWSATVDGRQTSILAANFAGRAVLIPGPGEHQIVFSYEAPLFRDGVIVSLVSLVLLCAIPLGARYRKVGSHGRTA